MHKPSYDNPRRVKAYVALAPLSVALPVAPELSAMSVAGKLHMHRL